MSTCWKCKSKAEKIISDGEVKTKCTNPQCEENKPNDINNGKGIR